MRFVLTEEQHGFARSLSDLLSGSEPVAAARAWAAGETSPGLRIWKRLAEQGVNGLVIAEDAGGMGGSRTDLVVAHEVLGHQLAVGPWVESGAYLATALPPGPELTALAEGALGTVAVPPQVPFALDAEMSEQVYLVTADGLVPAQASRHRESVDTTRRLSAVREAGASLAAPDPAAFDTAALACAAQLLGCGERLLEDSVSYVKARKQFGRQIGSYQVIKHQLADVRIGLDFARPLIQGAALADVPVSAAKVAAGDAAYRASRVALQVHGAIGYTAEFDLGLWINRVRALLTAWGTPAYHRGRVLEAL